jgi:hypothetical protein
MFKKKITPQLKSGLVATFVLVTAIIFGKIGLWAEFGVALATGVYFANRTLVLVETKELKEEINKLKTDEEGKKQQV